MKTLNMLHGHRAAAHAVVCYGSVHGVTQHVGEDPRLFTRVSATIEIPAHFGASRSDAVLRLPVSIRSLLGNVEQKPLRLGDALGYSTRHGRSDVSGGRDRHVPATLAESLGNYASPPRSLRIVGDHNETEGGNR